ncbi:YdcF family protein [Entomomonas asaccharolytica]|uniref:YdcF family protein n=1 Tax=Entomomonas asaccharolytica TaxID=2785331 RepID=A0A974NEK4_9GAMM|nr:YdcF family protein [Entomomonas asaccharolytica]QQP85305.1 YdcF family protein [Entomomonas asaccharolytica]
MKWTLNRKKKMIFIAVILIYFVTVLSIILSGLKDNLFKTDLIVVLGTKVSPEGVPSAGLAARLNKAIEIYQQGYAPNILVSGGTGKEGYDESIAMADFLIARGIPASAIVKDGQGNNTRATARNTYQYMQQHQLNSVIVISQYYHIARIKLAFKHEGIRQIGSGSPVYGSWRDFYSVSRELLGYPIYFFNIK